MRKGVADLFLPYPVAGRHGLYIELKIPSKRPKADGVGGVSEAQSEFGRFALSNGYAWSVAYGWEDAADIVEKYLKMRVIRGEISGQYDV